MRRRAAKAPRPDAEADDASEAHDAVVAVGDAQADHRGRPVHPGRARHASHRLSSKTRARVDRGSGGPARIPRTSRRPTTQDRVLLGAAARSRSLAGHCLRARTPRPPGNGGKDLVRWGVLAAAVQRGYVAISVSQPGYGASDGPADFCGPITQHAVARVIDHFRAQPFVDPRKVAIQGTSLGAVVAALVGARDPQLAALVLISGIYDLSAIPAGRIADDMKREGVLVKADRDDRSALLVADRVRAATLILNGAKDDRTFPDQARSLAERIREHGTPAKAVIYPEFGHAIPPEVRAKEIDAFLEEHVARARSN